MRALLIVAVLSAALVSGSGLFQSIREQQRGKAFETTRLSAVRTGPYAFKAVPSDFVAASDEARVTARATYENSFLQTGWSVLQMHAPHNPNVTDAELAFSGGYLEGMVTAKYVWQHYTNTFTSLPTSHKALDWLSNNFEWTKAQVYANNATSDFWYQIGLQFNYFLGSVEGIQVESQAKGYGNFTTAMAWELAAMADLMDIEPAVNLRADPKTNPHAPKDWTKMPKQEYDMWFAQKTHCSSLFKVKGDMSDIFFGHATWFNFNEAHRIYKFLNMSYKHGSNAAKVISMSSYPGIMSSLDDFYLMDSGFATIETSLSMMDKEIYEGNVPTSSLLYWLRVMAANRMATTAPDWAAQFARHNSGTYNNQWMILDLNLFEPGKDLKPNTMWVAEQIPGLVASQDVTDYLRYGYYPSYNVPMNKTVFDLSGYPHAIAKQGTEMNDYQMCVRAQIFRRDQGTVTDLDSYKHMMQYNDYERDPISQKNPVYAIAARGDLYLDRPQCFGAYDAKVSSWSMWKQGMLVEAFSGPTPQQPTFAFNHTFAKCGQHAGLPEVFDFKFEKMRPSSD